MAELWEISELQAVDFALGSFISSAYQSLKTTVGPKEYRGFLSRPANRQVYRTDKDTPAEFLEAIRSSRKTAATVDGKDVNVPELPVLYFFRKPGFDNSDHTGYWGRQYANFDVQNYEVDVLPLVLNYEIKILAWDKPTLDKLALLWYAHLNKSHVFSVNYAIGDESQTELIPCQIMGYKTVIFGDESIPEKEGRLWAVGTDIEVHTQVIHGDAVSVDAKTVQFWDCGWCGDVSDCVIE